MASKATGHEIAGPPRMHERNHVIPRPPGEGASWGILDTEFPEIYTVVWQDWSTWPALDSNAERQVYVVEQNGGAYQKWRFIQEDDYWLLINLATGFALDGTTTDIYTMGPNDGSYQRWRLIQL
jgi:hypothetical protein